MSDSWDSYFCTVDDRPASILVDLDLILEAPVPGCAHMAYLHVCLRHPDCNGLVRQEEFASLSKLEDAVLAAPDICSNTVYVGRCITDGRSELTFYTKAPEKWEPSIRAALADFPEYAWNTGVHEDPEWGAYLDFLYPGRMDMLEIQNRRISRLLQEQGDNLDAARPVEHWLDFAEKENRAGFAKEAGKMGFTAEIPDGPHSAGAAAPEAEPCLFPLRLLRTEAPAQIQETTFQLAELADAFEGEYNGWGCSPTRE